MDAAGRYIVGDGVNGIPMFINRLTPLSSQSTACTRAGRVGGILGARNRTSAIVTQAIVVVIKSSAAPRRLRQKR